MKRDAVLSHYIDLLGKPSDCETYTACNIDVSVYLWRIGANPFGVNLYATVGASKYPVTGHSKEHRNEFFLGIDSELDSMFHALALVGTHSYRNRTQLGHGHTVTFEQPLWEGSEMRTLLIARADDEIIPTLVVNTHVHIEFLQVIPIFRSELDFKVKHGVNELFDRWEEERVPFWRADRSPLPA